MSNYKLEVENTEKLKNDIDLAFTEINTELKKDDDDLIAKDLFDVDKKIEELKKSRKKWATGTTNIKSGSQSDGSYLRWGFFVDFPNINLKFIPKTFVVIVKRLSDNVNFPTVIFDSRHTAVYLRGTDDPFESVFINMSKKSFVAFDPARTSCTFTWYAFE